MSICKSFPSEELIRHADQDTSADDRSNKNNEDDDNLIYETDEESKKCREDEGDTALTDLAKGKEKCDDNTEALAIVAAPGVEGFNAGMERMEGET